MLEQAPRGTVPGQAPQHEEGREREVNNIKDSSKSSHACVFEGNFKAKQINNSIASSTTSTIHNVCTSRHHTTTSLRTVQHNKLDRIQCTTTDDRDDTPTMNTVLSTTTDDRDKITTMNTVLSTTKKKKIYVYFT